MDFTDDRTGAFDAPLYKSIVAQSYPPLQVEALPPDGENRRVMIWGLPDHHDEHKELHPLFWRVRNAVSIRIRQSKRVAAVTFATPQEAAIFMQDQLLAHSSHLASGTPVDTSSGAVSARWGAGTVRLSPNLTFAFGIGASRCICLLGTGQEDVTMQELLSDFGIFGTIEHISINA